MAESKEYAYAAYVKLGGRQGVHVSLGKFSSKELAETAQVAAQKRRREMAIGQRCLPYSKENERQLQEAALIEVKRAKHFRQLVSAEVSSGQPLLQEVNFPPSADWVSALPPTAPLFDDALSVPPSAPSSHPSPPRSERSTDGEVIATFDAHTNPPSRRPSSRASSDVPSIDNEVFVTFDAHTNPPSRRPSSRAASDAPSSASSSSMAAFLRDAKERQLADAAHSVGAADGDDADDGASTDWSDCDDPPVQAVPVAELLPDDDPFPQRPSAHSLDTIHEELASLHANVAALEARAAHQHAVLIVQASEIASHNAKKEADEPTGATDDAKADGRAAPLAGCCGQLADCCGRACRYAAACVSSNPLRVCENEHLRPVLVQAGWVVAALTLATSLLVTTASYELGWASVRYQFGLADHPYVPCGAPLQAPSSSIVPPMIAPVQPPMIALVQPPSPMASPAWSAGLMTPRAPPSAPAPVRHDSLAGAHLEGAMLASARLDDRDLRGAHLQGSMLADAHLKGADLRWAHLEAAKLLSAHLKGADLRESHLEAANLAHAELKNADLRGAHLEHASLYGAKLKGADLRGAHVDFADLSGTYLKGARFDGAHTFGANFYGAYIKDDDDDDDEEEDDDDDDKEDNDKQDKKHDDDDDKDDDDDDDDKKDRSSWFDALVKSGEGGTQPRPPPSPPPPPPPPPTHENVCHGGTCTLIGIGFVMLVSVYYSSGGWGSGRRLAAAAAQVEPMCLPMPGPLLQRVGLHSSEQLMWFLLSVSVLSIVLLVCALYRFRRELARFRSSMAKIARLHQCLERNPDLYVQV